MASGTSAWGNLAELYHCVLQSGGSGHCALFTGDDSGFGIALVIVLALNIGGIILSYLGLVLATDPAAVRLPDRHRLNVALGALSACLWCYLWLAYALPECTGHTYIAWMIISPLFTLVLMIGFIGMVAAITLTVGNVTSGRRAWGLSGEKWAWALLTATVTGMLIGWHALYEAVPQIAAGPYGRGPGWFQDALGIWTLHLPVTAMWALAKALATTPGIVAFAVLAALSLILPRRTTSARAVNLAAGVITMAVGEMAGLVVSAFVLIVVSLLAVATAALAFMFFAAYVMAYALVIAFLAALVVGAVRN